MNLAVFINDERQCDWHSYGKYLGDLPMGVVRFICGFCESVIRRYLRTAVRFREPTKELRIFACRLSRQRQLFAISLICGFRSASTKIPCHDVFVCFKLRIKRCAGRYRSDGIVELAACFGRVPALKAVPLFDGKRCGDRRLAVRLNSFIVRCFTVDQTAVAARVPSDGQADGCAAIVALAVAVGIHMVGVFITGSLTNRASFCALMLRIVCFRP